MEEKITLSKSEYDSRIRAISMMAAGIGIGIVGVGLLFDKKIEKTTGYGILGGGAVVFLMALAYRKIDKLPGSMQVDQNGNKITPIEGKKVTK